MTPGIAATASAVPADGEAEREAAVSRYVDGATRELDAYRQQIDASARGGNRRQLDEARARLEQCDRLVASLRTADQGHFDRIKSDYERAREELAKALRDAQKS